MTESTLLVVWFFPSKFDSSVLQFLNFKMTVLDHVNVTSCFQSNHAKQKAQKGKATKQKQVKNLKLMRKLTISSLTE